MRAEHQRRTGRHFGQVLDEDRALGLQVVDDIGVVHDLVAHVDRRAELRQRALDDLDRTVDAGAEAARLGQHDLFQPGVCHHSTPISCTSKVTGWPASGWLKSNSSAFAADFAHDAGIGALPVGRGELDDVADVVLLVGVAQLVEQRALHPLQQLGVALAERFAGVELE